MLDGSSIYEFVVSKKSDFLFEHEVENHIKPNYIITITKIKKTKGGERFKRTLDIPLSYLSKEKKKITETNETLIRRADMHLCTKIL